MGSEVNGFQISQKSIEQTNHNKEYSVQDLHVQQSRKDFLSCIGMSVMAGTVATVTCPENSNALTSYSANARNLERMNSGDMSGGSIYDNNPKSAAGKKRRAMVGCKNSIAREEAAETVLGVTSLSEFDCNQKVMDGESEFMLEALRKLECPTCPYGISPKR